jgi:hypothetical protein
MEEKFLWWGYRHVNGNYQVKRYFEPLDIQEAQESPFCAEVSGTFRAEDREDAFKILKTKIR